MSQVAAYIKGVNADPGRKRLRDWARVKNPKQLVKQQSQGKRVVDRTKQAVPEHLFKQIYPRATYNKEETGLCNINGKEVLCVYVPATFPPKPHHYDIEHWTETRMNMDETLGQLDSEDGSDEEEVLAARSAKVPCTK
jgi:hypothetical protein